MKMDRIRGFDPNLIAVLGGALSAACTLFPLNFSILSFLIAFFALLPLFLVGLCWGFSRLLLGSFASLGMVTIGAGPHAGIGYFITTLLPALLMVYRFHKNDPFGYIVSWVTGLTIAIFISVLLILSAQSVNALSLLDAWFAFFADAQTYKKLHGQIIPLLPGISSISWICMCFINAAAALLLAIKGGFINRPYFLPKDAQLHENWDLGLAVCLLLILTDAPLFAFMGKNIALISCVPLFLVGLKVAYAWLRQFENPGLWIVGIIFMSIFLVGPAIFIVIFGILEPTVHFCQRLAPNKK